MRSVDSLLAKVFHLPLILANEKVGGGGGRKFWIHKSAKSPFDYLTNYSVTPGAAAGTYASVYRLLIVCSIVGFFVMGGITWVRIMLIPKDGAARNEMKKALEMRAVIVCGICALTGVISWVIAFWKGVL